MKSFSSSAVNKSGKKFAPKAQPRRGAPGPAAPARRPSAAQQSQAQAAQAQQQEKEITKSVPPPSVSSAEPEHPVTEAAPAAIADSTQAAPVASKSATAIPIPLPKRKVSISKTVPDAAVAPAITSTSIPDTPPSSRTLSTEAYVVPSIEDDAPQPTSVGVTAEAAAAPLPTDDSFFPDEALSPRQSVSEPQVTPSAPVAGRPLKWAKKTSEITGTRGRGPVHAIAPPAPSTASSETPGGSLVPVTPEASQETAKGKKRKASKASTSDAGPDSEKSKRRQRKREPTPEGAEMVEILPNVVRMSELCKDLKTGRKSKRETELRKLELEEQERKQKAQEEGSTTATPKKTNNPDANKTDRLQDLKPQSAGPVMRIVNGEIVLDNASLEVDRHADAARTAGDLEDVVENQLTRKVNQATYGKRTKTEAWDEEMTDLFYRGLRMFGTDFMVISKLFPGRSRRQIKLKFNNEERKDPQRIKDTLLGPRETIDIATYSEMTNQVYDDPKIIQQELDDEKKRIEEQHEKEKKLQEEMMRNPTGAGADENATSNGDKANGVTIKGKRNSKRNLKNAAGGGTEEVLGSIDDIPMA
ncbi:uncharacterized protein N7482_005166 [Penicillium canariense]|uniref:Myb-like domain-containing protein n=1 Tax=Penicillium canariense TaxID=189055 RepID=A0A9W9I4A7_9EURO|nr:uncharacterized protein N7482_005166 [Penicillium canariense]KAJ5166385.1 hypothetical protein N7482_005166 [Penicillium canariense]